MQTIPTNEYFKRFSFGSKPYLLQSVILYNLLITVKIVNSDSRVGPLAILNAEAYCRHRLLIFAKVIGLKLPI